MSEQNSLVSVIIPVYNGEKYLGEAIESVLAQTYQHRELIVINDGSTDNTSKVISQYKEALRYYFHPHAGLPATLNKGMSFSKGEWIAFLDADDLWLEDKLTQQIKLVKKDPNIEIVFTHVQQFISPELDESTKRRIYCPPDPIPGFNKQTMMAHKVVFDKVGLFSEQYSIGDFVDWYLRASEANLNIHILPEVLAKRRLHASHTTDGSLESRKGYARILKAHLDRRRTQMKSDS